VMPVAVSRPTDRGAGQGLDPRVAEPQGPPPVQRVGRVRDPLKGWTREDAALADARSVSSRRRLAARARAWRSSMLCRRR
jgi:hypothetical protein